LITQLDPLRSPTGFQFVSKMAYSNWSPEWIHIGPQGDPVCIQAAISVTHGFHFGHPNGSTLVTQGAPVCIKAAVLVTQGSHFDHPNGSILVTQVPQFASTRPCWSPNDSILTTPVDPFWSPKGLQVCIQVAMLVTPGFHFDHPNISISVTQGAPVWSPNGL